MSEIRKQSFTDDGRRAEFVVKAVDNGCEKQTITEVYVEPKVTKKLAKVVIEDEKPFVYKRTTEVVDEETGEVVERTEEDLNPGTKLQVVERIVSAANQVHAASYEGEEPCYVTRDELREDILAAIASLDGRSNVTEPPAPLRVQNYVANRVAEGETKGGLWDLVVKGVIVAQVVVIVYIVAFKSFI